MRLSEAIRLGAMMKPQCFGTYFKGGGSCAIGAAYDAAGVTLKHGEMTTEDEERLFPVSRLIEQRDCPSCGSSYSDRCGLRGVTPSLIPHLNDDHRLSREAIADFIEGIESQQPAEEPLQEQAV